MNKRLIALSVELVVIGMLLGASIVQALTPSAGLTISSGVYPGAPSYTVWKEGSNYYAKDLYGVITYSGTNFSQIVTDAISSFPNSGNGQGQTILLKNPEADRFYITAPILVDRPCVILGEGAPNYYTQIKNSLGASLECFFNVTSLGVEIGKLLLNGEAASYGIFVNYSAPYSMTIHDITATNFDTVLYIRNVASGYFHWLNFYDFSTGIYMTGNCWHNLISQVFLWGNRATSIGLDIEAPNTEGLAVTYNHFIDLDIEDNGAHNMTAIKMRGISANNYFSNTWIETQTTYWDFDLNNTIGSDTSNNYWDFGHLGYSGGMHIYFGTGALNNTISCPSNTRYVVVGSLTDNGSGNRIYTQDQCYNGTWYSNPFP